MSAYYTSPTLSHIEAQPKTNVDATIDQDALGTITVLPPCDQSL